MTLCRLIYKILIFDFCFAPVSIYYPNPDSAQDIIFPLPYYTENCRTVALCQNGLRFYLEPGKDAEILGSGLLGPGGNNDEPETGFYF